MSNLELKEKKPIIDGQVKPPGKESTPAIKFESICPGRQFRFGRHLAFAIDDDTIQMAASTHSLYGPKLLHVSKAYIPQGDEGEDTKEKFLKTQISEFARSYGGRKPTVSLTVSGPETALRILTLPDLKGSDLRSAVGFEANRQLPFPINECLIDYQTTQQIVTGQDKHLRVSVQAATENMIQQQLDLFDQVGLDVTDIYYGHCVVGQLIPVLPDYDHDSNYTLINILRSRCEIAYYQGSVLEFVHVGSIGSSLLSRKNDLTTFEYFAESLATEIQNSLDYYTGHQPGSFSNVIYINGDLTYSDELINLLSDRFGFTFKRFPIEESSSIGSNNLPFAEALPVCLPTVAAVTNRTKLPNLIPYDRAEKRRVRIADRLGIATLLLLISITCISWFSEKSSTAAAQSKLVNLQRQADEFRSSAAFTEYNHIKRKITTAQAYLEKAKETPSYLSLNLKELAYQAPATVQLKNLEFSPGSSDKDLVLTGVVETGGSSPELVLAEFVENLTASPFFEDVTVDRHLKKSDRGRFTLEFSLSMKGII